MREGGHVSSCGLRRYECTRMHPHAHSARAPDEPPPAKPLFTSDARCPNEPCTTAKSEATDKGRSTHLRVS